MEDILSTSTSTGFFWEELASVQPSQQATKKRLLTLRNKQRRIGQACRQKKKKIIKLTSELKALEEDNGREAQRAIPTQVNNRPNQMKEPTGGEVSAATKE